MSLKNCLGFNSNKTQFMVNGLENKYPYLDSEGVLNVEAVKVDETEITYICPCCRNKGSRKPVLHRHGSCGDTSERKTHRATHCISTYDVDPYMKGVYIHITKRTIKDFDERLLQSY